MNQSESPLKIENLSHTFDKKKALDRVSFEIRPGEMTVLLGKNGAGKTTLFSLITRLYSNQAGSISVFGESLSKNPVGCLSKMGVVFQQRTLDPDLSVFQNLYYHCKLQGLSKKTIRTKISEEVRRFDLEDMLNKKVRKLSGGQVRRVEIIRSLLHEPGLLLMDECTVGLDVESRNRILEHTVDLCKTRNIAVLWATHLLDEIGEKDRLVVLHHGKVLSSVSVDETLKKTGTQTVHEAFAQLTES